MCHGPDVYPILYSVSIRMRSRLARTSGRSALRDDKIRISGGEGMLNLVNEHLRIDKPQFGRSRQRVLVALVIVEKGRRDLI